MQEITPFLWYSREAEEAAVFVVHCDNQAEIDRYWNALLEGGSAEQCGRPKDRPLRNRFGGSEVDHHLARFAAEKTSVLRSSTRRFKAVIESSSSPSLIRFAPRGRSRTSSTNVSTALARVLFFEHCIHRPVKMNDDRARSSCRNE
jgi:hypothetical protein